MKLSKSYLSALFLLLVAFALAACSDADSTPTPPPVVATESTTIPQATAVDEEATAVPASPTPIPSPTIASLGLVPLDDNSPLPAGIIGQNPAPGQEVGLDGTIEIYFDQPMDPDKTASAWQFLDEAGQPLTGSVTWPQARVLRFEPTTHLKPNTSYKAVLAETAVTLAGQPLSTAQTFSFNTVGELSVSQISPAPDSQNVAIDSSITVIFNRPVVPLLMSPDQTSLPQPLHITPETSGQGEWLNTSVYIFTPDKPLLGRQTYTVAVDAAILNAASTSGAQMPADYSASFTVTPPTFRYLEMLKVTSYPQDNFVGLRLNQAFRLYFNQAMDPVSTETAVRLGSDVGDVPLETRWSEDFTSLTITPTQLMALDSDYVLEVADTAQSSTGGRLDSSFVWHASTVHTPAIVSTTPSDGDTAFDFSSLFSIQFASPMDRDSFKGKVIITPAPSGDPDGEYSSWDRTLRFYGFAPSTSYTVQILPGMSDPYGNLIQEGQTVRFTTAPYSPYVRFNFPDTFALYRVGGSTAAWVTYRNVDQVNVSLYKILLPQFRSMMSYETNPYNYTPPASQLIWSQDVNVSGVINRKAYQRFDLLNQEGKPLAPGLYFMTLDSPTVSHEGNKYAQAELIIVSTANLVLKTTPSEAMLWLTDLTTGQGVRGVPLVLYDANSNEVFRANTNEDGIVYVEGLEITDNYNLYAVTDAPNVFGMAMSNWSDGVDPYEFGVSLNYDSSSISHNAYIYTDRPIYRPGQTVYFKAIVRTHDDLDYAPPVKGEMIHVVVTPYYGETLLEKDVPLSEFGTAVGEITLDSEAMLGGYSITFSRQGEYWGGISFNVAEYRKPTFQVTVKSPVTAVAAGDTIPATVSAQYYSGGSVVNSATDWTVYSTPFTFSPEGQNLSRYSFSNIEQDTYYGYYRGYEPSTTIASESGVTDGQGLLTLSIPAELSDEEGSRVFNIEASSTDIAGNIVSGRTSVIVHRSLVYPGIRQSEYVAVEGEPMSFDLIALDWDSQPQANQALQVEVVKRNWYSVQEENEFGETIWRSSVEEVSVETFNDITTSADGKATISFTPPEGGVYRAYVRTTDSKGSEAVASTYLWVSGKEYIPWRRSSDHGFELVSDGQTYQPGDTAEILIASPFQGTANALITVERGHIRQYETVTLTSNSTIYKLPITVDMAPNVYVSVLVIKGVDETNPAPDFKFSLLRLDVALTEQILNVEVTPDKTTAGPGDEVTYTVKVTDFHGQPVDAEVSLSLADLAVLSLAEPNSGPMGDFFYTFRYLAVRTALILTQNMDAFNQALEEEIKGGGGGDGLYGVDTVRQKFLDTAYWEGQLQTGADGEASVTVTLPDNLTTWRMDARAVTKETQVGQTTVDIVTTLPLLVEPQTPRFFVVGDKAQVGTAVHNNSANDLTASVTIEAEGVTLESPATQEVTIPAGQQGYVVWDVTIADVDRVDFVFTAISGDLQDASKPPLGTLEGQGIPVYRYEVSETVGTSGQLLESGAVMESVGLPIFPDTQITEGDLSVEIAPSLAAAMTDGLDYLTHYPYECTEQVVSKFLPNVLTTRALLAAGIEDPALKADLNDQVAVGLQKLYGRQLADGGWPWWDGDKSDELVTAYVVQALVEAKESGYNVSQGVIDQGASYLRMNLPNLDTLDGRYKYNRQAYLLYVLTLAGSAQSSTLDQLYDKRDSLDLYARGYLAQAMVMTDAGDPRLVNLKNDFINAAILSATGTNWEEKERDYWNWGSDTRTTAVVLDTMIQLDPTNPLVANAVRWLMAHRTNGRWASTQETAWTLMALTNWMVTSGELEADYQYEVALNGQLLGNGTANADTLRTPVELHVAVSDLFSDQLNRLAIGHGEGPGNLYYTVHLRADLPVVHVQPLDQGLVLSRSYYSPEDHTTPITEIEQGETFIAKLTIVVPNTLHYVIIEDPLPAGLEAVDQSLKTSQQGGAPDTSDFDDYQNNGWGWWYFNHVELRDEKVVISTDYLPAGTYQYVYLVRATIPGEYQVIPPTGYEFYFPEVYGRGAGSLFTVK